MWKGQVYREEPTRYKELSGRGERIGLFFVLGSKEGMFGIGKSGQCVRYFRISMIPETCPFDVKVKRPVKVPETLFKGLEG